MYSAGRRVGLSATVGLDVTTDTHVQGARVNNLVWMLARLSNPQYDKAITSWTGFIILLRSDKLVVQDTVSQLPTINAPATDIMETLELKEIVCVFD